MTTFRTLLLSLSCTPLLGQRMVADLTPGSEPWPTALRFLGAVGARQLFTSGVELWVTDGTAAGSSRVSEIELAGLGAPVGSRLVFPTVVGNASALQVTDGVTVAMISRLGGVGGVVESASLGARAVFVAGDLGGLEPWVTDGTAAGTRLLADIFPGPAGSWPAQLVRSGGLVYFFADDGVHGRELWRTDGTAAGTFLVGELVAGNVGVLRLVQMVPFAGGLLFPFNDTLYATDGSAGSLRPIVALPPNAYALAPAGSRLLFAVGYDLWSTDGTAPQRLRSFQGMLLQQRTGDGEEFTVELNGSVLFLASDGVAGFELWRSDGTVAGTRMVVDLAPGAADSGATPLFRAGNLAYFLANAGPEGRELWVTDGTAGGTRLLADLTPGPTGSMIASMATLPGKQLLRVDASGSEVWSVDASGAQRVFAVPVRGRGTYPLQVSRVDDGAVIRYEGATGQEVARITAGGQVVPLGAGTSVAAREAELAFLRGPDLLVHDLARGTRLGYRFAPPLVPTQVSAALGLYLVSVDSPLGQRLWRSDGTAPGTFDLGIDAPYGLLALGDRLFLFGSNTQPAALLVHDGRNVVASLTLPAQTDPSSARVVGNRVLFLAGGVQLWATDGTQLGTRSLYALSGPLGARLASDGVTGYVLTSDQLVVTDGTAAGTRLVSNLSHAVREELAVVDGRAFFVADDLARGLELWVSDGTAAGTVPLDVVPGLDGLYPKGLTAIGNRLAFTATEPRTGRELWVSDGTLAGTVRVADLRPGVAGSFPSDLVSAGAGVFCFADDGVNGVEPWFAPMALFGAAAVEPLAGGCAGSAGRPELLSNPPRLGDASHALVLGRANPSAAGVLMVGATNAAAEFGACALRLVPAVTLSIATSAAGGARLALPIPAQPSLLGAAVLAQVAVVDPAGALFGVASLTDGLRLVIGR